MTDCFLALMLPGAGDELQGIKRGLLELVDVIAVNKADGETRAAAELAAQQYCDWRWNRWPVAATRRRKCSRAARWRRQMSMRYGARLNIARRS